MGWFTQWHSLHLELRIIPSQVAKWPSGWPGPWIGLAASCLVPKGSLNLNEPRQHLLSLLDLLLNNASPVANIRSIEHEKKIMWILSVRRAFHNFWRKVSWSCSKIVRMSKWVLTELGKTAPSRGELRHGVGDVPACIHSAWLTHGSPSGRRNSGGSHRLMALRSRFSLFLSRLRRSPPMAENLGKGSSGRGGQATSNVSKEVGPLARWSRGIQYIAIRCNSHTSQDLEQFGPQKALLAAHSSRALSFQERLPHMPGSLRKRESFKPSVDQQWGGSRHTHSTSEGRDLSKGPKLQPHIISCWRLEDVMRKNFGGRIGLGAVALGSWHAIPPNLGLSWACGSTFKTLKKNYSPMPCLLQFNLWKSVEKSGTCAWSVNKFWQQSDWRGKRTPANVLWYRAVFALHLLFQLMLSWQNTESCHHAFLHTTALMSGPFLNN